MVSQGIKVYEQENIFNKDFNLGNSFITDLKYESLKTCTLYSDDVVLSMMGTIGSSFLVPKDIKLGIMNSHLLRIQTQKDLVEPEFLALLLDEYYLMKIQIRKLSQGGIMSGLSASIVKELVIPIPPISEQKKIISIITDMDNLIKTRKKQLDKIQSLKKSLMQDLLTGKVRVSVN